jgi:hypothetical protein
VISANIGVRVGDGTRLGVAVTVDVGRGVRVAIDVSVGRGVRVSVGVKLSTDAGEAEGDAVAEEVAV